MGNSGRRAVAALGPAGAADERQARGARWACPAGARQARGLGVGRKAWAPGLARTVHSVHRLDFQTGFRLGIFSESVNEHCSL